MKKITAVISAFFLFFLGWGLFTQTTSTTEADWWVRPTEREIQPTRAPRVSLAPRTASDLTPTLPSGETGTISPTDGPDGSLSNENPCASGKSYTGSNCGWSPGISEYKHDPSSGDASGQIIGYGVGGPEVLGLSYTGSKSNNVGTSDIMLLLGVLCLLVYAKTKFGAKKARQK